MTHLPSRFSRRAVLTGAGVAVAGGGAAWAAERFLIPHVENSDVAAAEAAASASNSSSTGQMAADRREIGTNYYRNGQTQLTIANHSSGNGSDALAWFVADLRMGDATVLRSAFANNQFGENITQDPSTIATAHDAVFAVNGDYYGFRDDGIEVRNGVAWRDKGTRQGLSLYRDGAVRLYDETATNAAQLVSEGVWNTLSFGPGVVADSQVVAGIDQVEVDTNVGNHSIQGDQPRTGIGYLADGHLALLVVDGRSEGYSRGVTLPEFAQMFVDLGARTAYNLDGGGSSVMYFNGSLVNNPLGTGRERGVSDILYLA
ncbi:phosphodiester glycosidase family protein [Propionibacterium freudenreichii]|uniref:Exopolysaccharide biosynthesis protein related to N-acetylglucosamine-1-phosphodiester alpha-N-acetylglucosaminidase n=3 Tax=Propionibacterium freudenreichii TaxID=1744 RepID=A0A0A8PEZ7_9ACTN|nr:phosphodiester glycosidase family protein [Propionibacterium freudenreichii]MDN5962572.1 phosphodiester glycosidase family protein [Propionibacterium sp.]AJQ90878.1 Exopolysaccharide biosynthesis protein related to N-acetylglucosamine-1-phosphodiester alpha-N-acetylglucosaminidase [Propionibacterium freudenreichii subsp. freudenreichii]ARO11883.1 exopolysaccharide biosynthesis protein [Propionibacterium freudenreichii]AWY95899.1 Exopolysaccharide biosynthesis protein related to N-acetylgluco